MSAQAKGNTGTKPSAFNPKPLQRARRLRGLTYDDLASRIGMSTPTVWNVLNGKSASPQTVFKLCAELGIQTDLVWR